jgi:hypothetical protein
LDSEFVKVEREREAAFVCFFNEEGDGKHDDDKKEIMKKIRSMRPVVDLPIAIELRIKI